MQSGASTTPAAPAAGVVEARLKMNYAPMKSKDGRGKTRCKAKDSTHPGSTTSSPTKKQRAACALGPAVRHGPKVRYRAPACGDGTTTLDADKNIRPTP